MATNVGNLDRTVRGVAGVALLTTGALTTGTFGVVVASILMFLGSMNILASATGTCVLYRLLGFKTCPMDRRREKAEADAAETA